MLLDITDTGSRMLVIVNRPQSLLNPFINYLLRDMKERRTAHLAAERNSFGKVGIEPQTPAYRSRDMDHPASVRGVDPTDTLIAIEK